MKYVLRSAIILVGFLTASCSPGEVPAQSTVTRTSTLRPLLTATATSTPLNLDRSTTQLVPSDPTATPFVHIVQQGDTLLSIALRYGVGLEELVLVNPGIDPQFLTLGQSLRIPGPEGEAVDVLLATPTPVAIEASPVRCFEALTGEFRCISTLVNDLPVAVEAISGIIALYNGQGEPIAQKSSDSTLQLIPSSQSIPLSVIFNEQPDEYAYADVKILSAIQVDPDVSRFVPVVVEEMVWDAIDLGRGALVAAEIGIPNDLPAGAYLLRVLGSGINAGGEIIGFRLVEEVVNSDSEGAVQVEFYIFSLGPPISDVQVVAEMIRFD